MSYSWWLDQKKKKIVETILDEPDKTLKLYQAARVKPSGELTWIVAEKQ